MLADQEPEERSARHEATEWLIGYLHDKGGTVPAGQIIKAAERDGIASRTLQRSRNRAGVRTSRTKNGWIWTLQAAPEASTDEGANQGAVPSDTMDLGALAPCLAGGALQGAKSAKAPSTYVQGGVAPTPAGTELEL